MNPINQIAAEKGTKERIRDVAIDLFSQKGYNAVSIREIARTVGINESSIYNHYVGKEDIMNSIIEFLINESQSGPLEIPMEVILEKSGPKGFMNAAVRPIIERLKNPYINKIVRLICIELYRNEKIQDFFKNTFMEPSYLFWEQFFQKMMDFGYIREYDARLLAAEFFNYCIYLYFDHFLIHYDESSNEELIDKLLDDLSRHVEFFFDAIRTKEMEN